MTFDLLEKSRWGGQPIGLLMISRGSLVERYTNADREVEVGADVFLPLPITRSAIRDSAERGKGVLTLTLPVDAPCAAWWRPYPPSSRIGVTWLAKHRGSSDVVVEWTGRVIGPKFSDTLLTLSCEPTKTDARSRAMALRWQRGCPLPLYSQGVGMCNVDKALHAVPAVLTSAAGLGIQAAEFSAVAPGRLAGGFVEWTRPDGEPEVRSIMAHDGDLLLLQYGGENLAPGLAVTAYPGCPHTFAACRDLFSNEPNYGGALFMPRKSPFDGNPV